MKILWMGDAGAPSGFGRVTHAIGERLVAMGGHEVDVLASSYDGDHVETTLRLHRAAKSPGDIKGRQRIQNMLLELQPDAVVILEDPWVVASLLHNIYDPQGLLRSGPVEPIAYMPIDGEPLAPQWREALLPVRPVAMSHFGQRQLPGSDLIFHGVDSDVFRPVEEAPIVLDNGRVLTSKQDCKEAFGYDPDGFLVLRVDRNSWRKDFGSTWRSIVPLMEQHADVEAHFHCAENDPSGGPILPALFSQRPDLADRFHTPDKFKPHKGWTLPTLVALYNAADVFVSNSMGEGFGLTIAEALACGVPVIAQDCSAISEVAGAGALLVPPGEHIMAPGGHFLRLSKPGEFAAMLEAVYDWTPSRRAAFGAMGRDHVIANFNWDRSAEQFHDLILDQASRGPRGTTSRHHMSGPATVHAGEARHA